MTTTGHSDLPGGQGNVHADDVTGSGQKTATGHAESGPDENGIDLRIETRPVSPRTRASTSRAVAVRRPRPVTM